MPRAPHLQSYASAAPSRSTVTSYGWISARTPSNRIRRSRRTAAAPTRRARSRAVSSSTSAPRTWLRTCSPRSATARDAARIASERAASPASPVAAGPNRVGNIVRQPAGVDRLAVHHRPGQEPLGGRRVGQQRRRCARPAGPPGCRRRRRPGRRVAASWNLTAVAPIATQDDLRERRQPVDRAVRILDPADLVDRRRSIAALASSEASSSPRRAATSSSRVRHASVRSLTYDHSSSISSPSSSRHGVGIERAVDQVTDRLVWTRRKPTLPCVRRGRPARRQAVLGASGAGSRVPRHGSPGSSAALRRRRA